MELVTADDFFRDIHLVKEKPFGAFPNGTAKGSKSRNSGVRRTFIKGVFAGVLLSHAVWLVIFLLVGP